MSARRGDIVLVRSRKHEPYQAVGRPALVVQSDDINSEAYDSLAVCLITGSSTRGGVCRIEIPASSETGLDKPSEIMVEKIAAVPRAFASDPVGRADAVTMGKVERALVLLLGLA